MNLRESSCLCFPSTGITYVHPYFLWGSQRIQFRSPHLHGKNITSQSLPSQQSLNVRRSAQLLVFTRCSWKVAENRKPTGDLSYWRNAMIAASPGQICLTILFKCNKCPLVCLLRLIQWCSLTHRSLLLSLAAQWKCCLPVHSLRKQTSTKAPGTLRAWQYYTPYVPCSELHVGVFNFLSWPYRRFPVFGL